MSSCIICHMLYAVAMGQIKIVCVDCLLAMLNVVWIKSFYRMVMTYPRLVI